MFPRPPGVTIQQQVDDPWPQWKNDEASKIIESSSAVHESSPSTAHQVQDLQKTAPTHEQSAGNRGWDLGFPGSEESLGSYGWPVPDNKVNISGSDIISRDRSGGIRKD